MVYELKLQVYEECELLRFVKGPIKIVASTISLSRFSHCCTHDDPMNSNFVYLKP